MGVLWRQKASVSVVQGQGPRVFVDGVHLDERWQKSGSYLSIVGNIPRWK
jgi:hypothetical protein